MAASTRSRMPGLTPYALRITFDTAARETPASRATSLIVTDRLALFDMGSNCRPFSVAPSRSAATSRVAELS